MARFNRLVNLLCNFAIVDCILLCLFCVIDGKVWGAILMVCMALVLLYAKRMPSGVA